MRPDIEAIESRVLATTPGVWKRWSGPHLTTIKSPDGTGAMDLVCRVQSFDRFEENADFIANAHQDIPALIAYVRELEARHLKLQNDFDSFVESMNVDATEQVQAEMATLRATVSRLEAKCRQQQQEMMAIQTELSRSVVQ